MTAKKVLVLGGGVAGFVASTYLKERGEEFGVDFDVTLVTASEWFYMPPLWMDIALEGLPVERTRAPIRGLEKYGVRVVVDPAVSIDPANRLVFTERGNKFEYDYLVVGLGVRNGWEAYPGLAENGYHNYDPESAQRLHEALKAFKRGKITILAPEMPFRCGIYPVEMATVLAYRYSVIPDADVEVNLVIPKSPQGMTPINGLGPDIEKLWMKYINRYGVKVHVHSGLERVDGNRKVVVTKEGEIPYDLLIKVPPPRLPAVLDNDEFRFDRDPRFAVARAPDLRHPKYDDIYLPGEHSLAPVGLGLAGVFVHNAAVVTAQAILADAAGVGFRVKYPSVTCVAYVADAGWIGMCEVDYDSAQGMYRWNKCYAGFESPLLKMVKRGFYYSWLSRMRVTG